MKTIAILFGILAGFALGVLSAGWVDLFSNVLAMNNLMISTMFPGSVVEREEEELTVEEIKTPVASLPVPRKEEVNGKSKYKFPGREEVASAAAEYQSHIDRAMEELEKNGLPVGSVYNMQIVMMQVAARFPEHLGEAIPYLTIKTYNGWKSEGRKVRKGEKAMQICVWVHPGEKNEKGEWEEDDSVTYPKTSHVFGIWQTEEM